MRVPRVNVIVSTYNGERYIQEQIDSILEQSYGNICIYVRDDGSADRTLSILEEYEKKGVLTLEKGRNLGFAKSFFALLEIAKEGDYWSFCDQDDIWYPDKVSRAVELLEREKKTAAKEIPLLCCSCSREVDEEGRVLGPHDPPEGSICFQRALTGTFSEGFSMVINKSLRDAMLLCDPDRVHSHDWLAGAIALGMGKVLADSEVCADHRRLGSSVSRSSMRKRILWFGQSLLSGGEVRDRNREFAQHFYACLREEDQKLMVLFNGERYSLNTAFRKAFYPKRWRPAVSSEIAMRVLMLLGRV